MKLIFIHLLFFVSVLAYSQQQVKIMQYNLLNFGSFTSYCTLNNNNPEDKVIFLKTVIDHTIPEILMVNEIGPFSEYHDLVLNDALNTSGRDFFNRAEGTNYAGSEIVNMLYYDSRKFGLAGQDVILNDLRDMNVYRLYQKSSGLAFGADTTFLYLISAHFKAGSSGGDKVIRAQMAGLIMDYIETNQISDACVVAGDLNLQNNLEEAWQILTAGTPEEYRLIDPADMEGIWHNNFDFAAVHTQSTNVVSNGCSSAGGMDDRFDFILTNAAMHSETGNIKFVEGSYETPGQDGLRFNGSLIDPPNYSAPADVIEAMFHLSDHLPVMVQLELEDDAPALPESWQFTPTMNSHLISVPVSSMPTLNQTALSPGSHIGAFYLKDNTEHCAGNILWSGTQNVVLVAYGDDDSSPVKEGFDEGEPIIFKVFSVVDNADFYADADFNTTWTHHDGFFSDGGNSELIRLDAFYLQFHTIEIDAGWSGISSFLIPKWRTLESIFGNDLQLVDYMNDGEHIFYPAGGIQQLKYWNDKSAIYIKADQQMTIEVEGIPVSDFEYHLTAGWNLVSVPVACYVPVGDLQTFPVGNINAVKSIAGTGLFWPAKEIDTMSQLVPGNSYLVNVTDDCILYFEPCN